ncbi:MAG: IS21-like element helper ATPase IstB [Anaerolineaceae bacterium]|nr:IS21-like element helper ATPase IstB [Anaerolineaceae bacterium]
MSRQPLLDNLTRLHLSAFRKALQEQLSNPQYEELSFEDRLSLLVDQECQQRDHNRIQRRIKQAHFHQTALVEDIDFSPERGFQRNQIMQLAQDTWIQKSLNLIISGPTGAGKTFMACALGRSACQQDRSVRYFRMPRFFQALKHAKLDGSYSRLLNSLAKSDLLIFDDWLRDTISLADAQDLLDILDDRYGRSSTMLVSQLPVQDWHLRFPDPTLADAILDRLVHNAYRIELSGDSQRKSRADMHISST